MAECLPRMHKATGLITSTLREIKETKQNEKHEGNFESGMVAYAYYASTQNAKARELQSHLRLSTPYTKMFRGFLKRNSGIKGRGLGKKLGYFSYKYYHDIPHQNMAPEQ